ncbi:MAG TPA: S1-like domain-containing RNA-binding protein [Bacteroidales bacterium]|nr:S1-like domain-containing RNA-binding protein [Bacteroidales bacterium]
MTEIAEQKYMPGKMNRLTIDHIEPHGAYLADLEGNQILLPTKWLPRKAKTGDTIEVFIYFDSEDRPIATIHKPLAQIGEIAFLQAADVNNVGAFLEWGPEKQLLVPFREQKARMEPGRRYLVYLYTDSETNRIAASAKIENFIDKEPVDYQEGQEVEIVLWDKTDLGFKAVIENKHQGLIYENEVFERLSRGLKRKAYISKLREDGKIDLRLQPPGYEKIDNMAEKILTRLKFNNGYLPLSDKSDAEDIYDSLEMSKKNFKKAIGQLFKKQLIIIEENGIRLIRGRSKE